MCQPNVTTVSSKDSPFPFLKITLGMPTVAPPPEKIIWMSMIRWSIQLKQNEELHVGNKVE
jgi:hypothetical protein